tara:strand:+ start:615 stop:995 length:381 start_codon:yes stop_codon:yes gene_type:complete
MGLKDMKSNLDRNTYGDGGDSGPNVGTTLPSEGTFHTGTPAGSSTSPFGVTMGLKSDQLVELMTKSITSNNHGYLPQGSITYNPSPQASPFQDMNGTTTDYGEGFVNPLTGNYDGRYTHPDTGGTF